MKQKNIGTFIGSWDAFDHYPHQRDWKWYALFCLIFFGIAALCVWADPVRGWITSLAFFVAASTYFWTHHKGLKIHKIQVFSESLVIDKKVIPFKKLKEYWFVYDEGVAVINFEPKSKKAKKIMLQMGHKSPEFFRELFSKTTLSENTEKKESLTDLWIRALKL